MGSQWLVFVSSIIDSQGNELEQKISSLYAKETSTLDTQEMIAEIYSVEVTAATVSTITDKVLPLVEEWQNRQLQWVYPIIYLNALYLKLRRDGKTENVCPVLYHPSDLPYLALCHLGYPESIHEGVAHCLSGTDTQIGRNQSAQAFRTLGNKYPATVRSWVNKSTELSTYFDFPSEIRRLIYKTNIIEGYNRQVQKVTKNKGVSPTDKAIRKLLYLAHRDIAKKWTILILQWAKIRNQLAIRFEGYFPL